MRDIISKIFEGVLAGILIVIGCAVYLAVSNKIVGACLFSIALLTICLRGYSLYTGKIGFIVLSHNKQDFSVLFLGLLGNVIATFLFGLLIKIALPNLFENAKTLCEGKLEQQFYQTLIRSVFCGILMFVAVVIYKDKNSIVGILFAIPVFILSGFEHSIADMGYFAISGIYTIQSFGFIWTVILGNTIGAMILPFLRQVTKKQ